MRLFEVMGDGEAAYCVHIFGSPRGGAERMPLFVMPLFSPAADLLDGQHERLDHVIDEGLAPAFALAVFYVRDWNADLSPWPATTIRKGDEDFRGNARQTLNWVLDVLIPEVERRVPAVRGGARGIVGYSMGGLFALWAVYQTDRFSVCASCSGSLWYEGFVDYVERNRLRGRCAVYLNLGMDEDKVRHPMFRKVGVATRRVAWLLEQSPMVRETAFKWFPGGHTGDVGRRIAAAQLWMARHL